MQDNIITADFSQSSKDTITTEGLWQYDRGIHMRILGISSENVIEVDFAADDDAEAAPMVAVEDDGGILVKIPDTMLQQPYDINAYIYVTTEEYGRTLKRATIPIMQRQKANPSAVGGDTENPLQDAIDKTYQYAQEAKNARDEAQNITSGFSETANAAEKSIEQAAEQATTQVGDAKTEAIQQIQQAAQSHTEEIEDAIQSANEAATQASSAAQAANTAAERAEQAAETIEEFDAAELTEKVTNLEEKVGEGFEDITETEIDQAWEG